RPSGLSMVIGSTTSPSATSVARSRGSPLIFAAMTERPSASSACPAVVPAATTRSAPARVMRTSRAADTVAPSLALLRGRAETDADISRPARRPSGFQDPMLPVRAPRFRAGIHRGSGAAPVCAPPGPPPHPSVRVLHPPLPAVVHLGADQLVVHLTDGGV